MRKAVIFLLIFCPLWAVSQRMHAHTVVDEHRKFTYTDTGGVTTSYVGYFGDRFVPGQFTTLDGEAINPADSAGCVFVYNFWFTACAPCVAEIPALNLVVEKFAGRRVYFVGIGLRWSRMQADEYPLQCLEGRRLRTRRPSLNSWRQQLIKQ